jgi:2,4-diaminopentanoate dehydrogenase
MLFGVMGFGKKADPIPPIVLPAGQGGAFLAPLMMIADALAVTIEQVEYTCDYAYAENAYEVTAGRIEAGTVAGKRYSFTATIAGRPALKIEHITRLGAHVAPEWPTGRGWYVKVEGKPSMILKAEIAGDDRDQNDEACLATAMHAVHAIPLVCAAPAGIRTFLDLPIIHGYKNF